MNALTGEQNMDRQEAVTACRPVAGCIGRGKRSLDHSSGANRRKGSTFLIWRAP
ncbi:hypothetical protein [Erwinia tasmaniensis]|uniref:hypothetical protein n=1 Tax=Erwinia tasmaniensis TaxID=338565 RepID=UPI003A4DFD1E